MAVRSLLAFILLSIAENALATSTVGTGELLSKCKIILSHTEALLMASITAYNLSLSADNVATCDLTAVTQSSSQSVSVAAESVAHVNSFLCGGNVSVPEEASAHALAVANSFVNAVVATSAECYAGAQSIAEP